MAATGSAAPLNQRAMLVLVLIGLVMMQAQVSESQLARETCSTLLSNLNVCGPFVVPRSASPSTECCTALAAVDRGCFCETIQIASRLPAQCNIAPLRCGRS